MSTDSTPTTPAPITPAVAPKPPYRGYFALVLDEVSKAALLARYATLPKQIGHHVTVKFGTDDPNDLPSAFVASDVGGAFALRVVGFKTRDDNGIQAVAVVLVRDGVVMSAGFSANAVPHITVALNPDLAKPVESNALLASGFDEISNGLELTATLQHVR